MKQMKDFKTKTELYAEYVRLMEKYEPEPVIKKPVIEKKPVIKKPVIEKKEEKIITSWSMEAYELAKKNNKYSICGYEKWRGIRIREYKLNNEEPKPDVECCEKCKKPFPYPTSYLLCGDCYAKFGYYKIEGNGANFKKFLGKDAPHNNSGFNSVLPKGKCLIKI